MAAGRPKEARQAIEERLQIDPEDSGLIELLVQTQKIVGSKSEALDAARLLLEHEPDDEDSHTAMGVAQLQNGDSKAAIQSFKEALWLNANE